MPLLFTPLFHDVMDPIASQPCRKFTPSCIHRLPPSTRLLSTILLGEWLRYILRDDMLKDMMALCNTGHRDDGGNKVLGASGHAQRGPGAVSQ